MRKWCDLVCRARAPFLLTAGLTLSFSRSPVVSQQQSFDDRMHVYMYIYINIYICVCVCVAISTREQRGNKANKVAGSMSDRAQLALSLTSRRTTTGESGARTKQD